MGNRFDIAVRDNNGNLSLAIEVKRRFNSTSDWAINLKDFMVKTEQTPSNAPFMIITPEYAYFWPKAENDTQKIDIKSLLSKELEKLGIKPENIFGSTFETVVFYWLEKVASQASEAEALQKLGFPVELLTQNLFLEDN